MVVVVGAAPKLRRNKLFFNSQGQSHKSYFNCPVGALKLNPVPGLADVVVIGFDAVVVPSPNEGKLPGAVVVTPNVTFVAGFDSDVKPNVVDVVGAAAVVVDPNAGSAG